MKWRLLIWDARTEDQSDGEAWTNPHPEPGICRTSTHQERTLQEQTLEVRHRNPDRRSFITRQNGSWSHRMRRFCITVCSVLVLVMPTLTFAGLACLSNPCINGVCIDDLNSTYSCYCIDGYTGVQCQTNWDECWDSPCKNGGTCIDGIAEYNCTCPEGYIGLNCEEDFDECDSNPCHNNATCVDASNGFKCSCLPGYSGEYCEMDLAVCNSTEEARCMNGGQCIEGLGMAFKCRCLPGWEGKLCGHEIDECLSDPCQNGGLCLDEHADYSCACRFGYTGKNCESKIELCTRNPCVNQALCMMEDSIRVCYCVPDFHGEKCQFQYDECLLGPKCMNGGTCIDGVDNFTCSCPPNLTGSFCECLILDDQTLDCQYVSPTPLTEEYDGIQISTRYTHSYKTTEYYRTTQGYEKTVFMDGTTENDGILVSKTHFPIDESSVPNTTLKSTFTSLDFNQSSTSPFISSTESTTSFKNTESSSTHHFITDSFESTSFTSETSTSEPLTSSQITTEQSIEKSSSIEPITSTDSSTLTIPIGDLSTINKTVPTTVQSLPSTTLQTVETDQQADTSTIDETTSSTKDFINIVTTESQLMTELWISPKVTNIETTEAALTTEMNELTTQNGVRLNNTLNETTIATTLLTGTSESITLFTESPVTLPVTTGFSFGSTTEMYETTTAIDSEIQDCVKLGCLNGGTCIHTNEEPKCVCKFDFDGPRCENNVGIATAAFSGDSFLTHKLNNKSGIHIELRARTLSAEGLILYSNIGHDIYMCLYMHQGLLKFKFSCGYQTMLLSELEVPINNGYELRIKAVLELSNSKRHCNSSLHINDTLAMSGGQVAARINGLPIRDSWLHLGSVPEGFGIVNHSPADVSSFTGCMMGLKIDGKPKNIFKDAMDGFEIKECVSLACLSNPCLNGGSCNDEDGHWTCSCANGYLGDHCQKSVCNVNPCQYGGTCVQYPGSGYLCLCPYRKHGLFCEHNLDIAQPSFSPMVGGLSSFAAYPLPQRSVSHEMEVHFKIQPSTMDQISLLAFLGQSGYHDPKSHHLAVTFVKGYIMLTWNLGNGPRRIFTSRPLPSRGTRSHSIKLGRAGRAAWLAVDSLPNITGNAPGNLQTLDVQPLLFLGGHESTNFSLLPHDLPLHGGFSGCIWDLWVGGAGGRRVGAPSLAWGAGRGRAVGQCSVTQCYPMACHNGGVCLHHAATYSCVCSDGWFGPLCNSERNPCDPATSLCAADSTCVPTALGQQCDCPLGKTGSYCDHDVELSDVSFSGVRSYLRLSSVPIGDVHFSLELEVHPLHPRGLLFYTNTHDGCFVSLSLQGGLLEYRWAGIEWSTRGSSLPAHAAAVVRSGLVLSLSSWHSVRAGRYGRRLFLWVDGTLSTQNLPLHQAFTNFNTSVYLGGVPDLSALPPDVMSGPPVPFTGCVRRLAINSQRFPLNNNTISDSRNIDDCDGGPCGGDVCWNGGSCFVQDGSVRCSCTSQYEGPHCTKRAPCQPSRGDCGRGRCEQGQCVCPNGWAGSECQNKITMATPQFSGNSFLVIDENKNGAVDDGGKLEKMRFKRQTNHIHINFTTAKPEGLLLWGEMNNKKYLSIGLEGGYLKMSWTLPRIVANTSDLEVASTESSKVSDGPPQPSTEVIKVLQAGRLSNGEWHTISLSMEPDNITLVADNRIVYEETGHGYKVEDFDAVVYIGGFPKNISTRSHTRGLFSSNFVGCVSELSFHEHKLSTTNFSYYESENVDVCQLFL